MLQSCDPDPHARCYAGKSYQRLVALPPELANLKALLQDQQHHHHKKNTPVPLPADMGDGQANQQ